MTSTLAAPGILAVCLLIAAVETGAAGAGARATDTGGGLAVPGVLPAASRGGEARPQRAAGSRHVHRTEQALRPGGTHLTLPVAMPPAAPLVRPAAPWGPDAVGEALFYRDWLAVGRSVAGPPAAAVAGTPSVPRAAPAGTRGLAAGSAGSSAGLPAVPGASLAGPDFDRGACAACHLEARRAPRSPGAGGRGDAYLVVRPVTAAGRARFGDQVNTRRTDDAAPEGRVSITYRYHSFVYPDGGVRTLRRPEAVAIDPGGEQFAAGLRSAPLLFGWGLLERVDREMLSYFDDPLDANGDGISGRLARAKDGQGVGLFGWKAAHASLESQIAAALANDMGVFSAKSCRACEAEAEITADALAALTRYVASLGVPDRRDHDVPAVRRGETLFGDVGCGECHVPVLLTGAQGNPAFADQRLWPYSDLVLHDMGDALADPGDAPDAREWRTAPLWGVGLVESAIPEHGFLHDGRARDLEEAILWHGGEAATARDRFAALTLAEREAVLAFVRAL